MTVPQATRPDGLPKTSGDTAAGRDVIARLAAFGTERVIGGDAPFVLEGDRFWIVVAGRVAVFATPMVDGVPGRRTHVFTAEMGAPLFGLDAGTTHRRVLLAVGATDTRVLEVSRQRLRELAQESAWRSAIGSLVEQWVELLCTSLGRDVMPSRCADLPAGRTTALPAASTVRSRPPVGWIKHLEGDSLLFGEPSLQVNGHGFTPLSRRVWLELRAPARLLLLETSALPDLGLMWEGLGLLHALVLRCVERSHHAAEHTLRERLSRKAAADAATLHAACTRLAATVDPVATRDGHQDEQGADACGTPAPVGHSAGDALLAACRLVGDARNLSIRRPPGDDGAPAPRDPLAGILRASRVRARKVVLRGQWWRHDHGPLLGSLASDHRAVALIPSVDRSYAIHDPHTGSVSHVTPAVAASLAPFAFTLYRPFPDSVIGIKDVSRFGLLGSRRDIVTLVLMGLAAALLGMVPAIATGMLFNSVIPGAQRSPLLQLTLILLVCAVTTTAFNIARGIALLRVEGRMGSAVQAAVWDRLLSLPLPFFRPYTAGDLAVRAMSIDAIRQAISGSTVTAILGGIFSIGNVGLMFYYSPAMAWRASLLIAVALVITTLGALLQLGPQRGVLRLQSKVSGLMLQLLSSVAKLRVAGAEMKAFELWARRFSEQRALQYQARRIQNRVAAFNAGFPIAASLIIFWSAHDLLGADTGVRTGDFLAFLSAFTSCSGALLSTFAALLSTLNIVPMYEMAKPILESRPEVDEAKSDPGQLSGDISVQHLVFRYHADGPLVLRDLTFRVEPGKFIALAGPSGSGKSTILRLLLGFERPEAGAVYYDGQELAGLDVQSVRRQLGVVLQSGRLMSGDIFTNIAGSTSVTIDEAWEAARMAGFADDIKSMPMGMHTVVGDSGGTLSGGQRQRLLIARAIVHRPRMLLFDEATSALDNRTQAIVSQSLERLQATRVVVAHRLTTIQNADRIYVINRGRIEEEGNYDELMRADKLFARLAARQIA